MGSFINRGRTGEIRKRNAEVNVSLQKSPAAPKFGRVLRVVMDNTDPDWEVLGGPIAQYGVFYQPIGTNLTQNIPSFNFAYCPHGNFKQVPVKNEIVTLDFGYSSHITNQQGLNMDRVYWTSIIPVWNSPHLNAYPNFVTEGTGSVNTGEYFKEKGDVYPLQLNPGDVSFEGRHGQSIRFGGTNYNWIFSPFVENDDNGKPYTIIRNGQGSDLDVLHLVKDGDLPITVNEDIDKDNSSIYLTSDHRVPLTQANDKRDAWNGNFPPFASAYKGAQIVANSDRVFINGRNDVELAAKEGIGLTAKGVHIDGNDTVDLDATKIHLGKGAFAEDQPTVLGTNLETWLNYLCSILITYVNSVGSVTGEGQLGQLGLAGNVLQPQIEYLQSQLAELKSKKIFTE